MEMERLILLLGDDVSVTDVQKKIDQMKYFAPSLFKIISDVIASPMRYDKSLGPDHDDFSVYLVLTMMMRHRSQVAKGAKSFCLAHSMFLLSNAASKKVSRKTDWVTAFCTAF